MSYSLIKNTEDKYKLYLLIEALMYGCLDHATFLIDARIGLNTRDKYGQTPLIIAITYGHLNEATALIDA